MCRAPAAGGAGGWLALCGALAAALARGEDGVTDAIRGVAPADLPKYKPRIGPDGSAGFRCFDSAGSGAVDLPYHVVNDDACDCADGSDEPGTDACAGQSKTLFYCKNEQSDAAYIYASRVNDGLCDCCDGSDEWRLAAQSRCQNTCWEEGRVLGKERAKKEAELRSGVEKRRSLAEAAAKEKRALEEELKTLKAELPSLEAAERQAKSDLERAKRLSEQEEAAAAAKTAPDAPAAPQASGAEQAPAPATPDELAAAALGAKPAAEAAPAQPPAEAAPSAEAPAASGAPVVSEYAKWMEGAGEALDAKGAAAAPEKLAEPAPSEAVVSEYAKWMEGADKALDDSGGAAKAASEPPPPTPPPPPKPTPVPTPAPARKPKGFFGKMWRKVTETWDWLWHKGPPPPVVAAQRALDDAEDKLRTSKDRKEEVEKKLGQMSGDDTLAYSNLAGRCLSVKVSEYEYKVCFFDRATQEGQSKMNVGSWGRWEEPGVALFDGGEMCPGGPARSLKVRFRCGSSEELLDVSEPSRCAYEAHASHPAACTEEQLEALLTRGPRRPTDEL